MSVCKMKKLTAAVTQGDSEHLTQVLEKLSCVELCATPLADGGTAAPDDTSAEEARLGVFRLENTIKKLTAYRTDKPGLFPLPERLSYSELFEPDEWFNRAVESAEEADRLLYRLAELKAEAARIESEISSLEPWHAYDLPLQLDSTRQTYVFFGTFPATSDLDDIEARLAQHIEGFHIERVAADTNAHYTVVFFHIDDDADILALLSQNGFVKLELSVYTGTAREASAKLERELENVRAEAESVKARLSELAAGLSDMKRACDIMRSKAARAEAKQRYAHTHETVILIGWVPERAAEKVRSELDKLVCAYSLDEPGPDDDPPTLLQNSKLFSPFETVIGMYSLPAYGTFDPTLIMSVFYFVIFGLMLGDFVYGLILSAGGFLALRFLHLGRGIKRLVALFAICGLSCMLSGVLFGGYLGDFPVVFAQNMLGIKIGSPALWFDPMGDPVKFLIVSLVVGFIHLIAGMCIKFYVLCVTGHPIAAIFDVGSWFIIYAGIGLYFVNSTVGLITAGTGALMLIVSQGRDDKNPVMKLLKGILSLYGFVNFVADLLSYSRIMALGMASAVIASVFNILSTLAGPSIIGYIIMVVILVVSNVINLAINLLGSFVHTSRLQYIEFFGKFFEDGGRPFAPLAPELEYSEITD